MVIHLNVTLLLFLYTVGCILCVSLIVMYFFYLQACLWDSSGQHGPFLLLQQVSGTQGCQCGCFFTRTEYGIEPDQFSQTYLNRLK